MIHFLHMPFYESIEHNMQKSHKRQDLGNTLGCRLQRWSPLNWVPVAIIRVFRARP